MPPTQFGVFQDVLTQFQTVTATWLGGLYAIGTNLFYMLATIELILVGITGTLRRDFDQLAIDLVRTIAGIMAMFTLFKYGPDFLQNGVILSFTGWASVAGHVPASAMTPGGVMTQGFQLHSSCFRPSHRDGLCSIQAPPSTRSCFCFPL
jgi:hypothetical protein